MAYHDGAKRKLVAPPPSYETDLPRSSAEEIQNSFTTRIWRESSSPALRFRQHSAAGGDWIEREEWRRGRNEGRTRWGERRSRERTRRWWKIRVESTAARSGSEAGQSRLNDILRIPTDFSLHSNPDRRASLRAYSKRERERRFRSGTDCTASLIFGDKKLLQPRTNIRSVLLLRLCFVLRRQWGDVRISESPSRSPPARSRRVRIQVER